LLQGGKFKICLIATRCFFWRALVIGNLDGIWSAVRCGVKLLMVHRMRGKAIWLRRRSRLLATPQIGEKRV
jgi:hypothetical protein